MIQTEKPRRRHPAWIRVRAPGSEAYRATRRLVKTLQLNTVCEEAKCPNIGECYSHGTATFMLLGSVCTRGCTFCAVDKGKAGDLDVEEPRAIAEAVKKMGLQHVVLTSVTRDDLPDGGSGHFAETIRLVKTFTPEVAIEVLIPDFRGHWDQLGNILEAPIDVLNHNTETVPRLYKRVRLGAQYERSLELLRIARDRLPNVVTKSGLMLGLGEERDELLQVFRDLREVGCDVLTLGQYLQPEPKYLPVERYLDPSEFKELEEVATKLGFRKVVSGPLVRSSYHAWEHVKVS